MTLVWDDRDPRSGWEQMAIDRAMLDWAGRNGTNVLRLYRWETDTISFGANESALRSWDRDKLLASGIPLVRRPSGGRAVWHSASDLTYAVTTPLDHFGGQRDAYRVIHERIAEALDGNGHATTLANASARTPSLNAGSCFDTAVGGEVLFDGRKAIGSAQLVIGKALLQHGEIARADRHSALARFARTGGGVCGVAAGPELPPADALAGSIAAAWFRDNARPVESSFIGSALEASLPWQAQFRELAWTWRR